MRRVPAAEARAYAGAWLDVREPEAFAAGHAAGSGHLERAQFHERRAELPPRDRPLLVVADEPLAAAAAAAELEDMGYVEVGWLEVPLARLPGGLDDHAPPVRLWRPAPYLEQALARIAAQGGAPHGGLAADLAAGSGREAVCLALAGYEVEAWDAAPEALARANLLARHSGVRVRAVMADLERLDGGLPEARYQMIAVFRFLHRPLFPLIERALAPGGWLVYETYRAGQERFGRPKSRRFLLDPGELERAFPTLEVIEASEPGPPEGPITAQLLARRPATSARVGP